MTRQLAWTIVADGGTDRVLVPIIQWAIHQLDPEVEILEPEFRKRKGSVGGFLADFSSGSMLVFVHRDAEGASLDLRRAEFESVTRNDVVPVIPVRMSEAWLLIDETAIARAADSPDAQIDLPKLADLESLADPKQLLGDLLYQAAGSPTGRHAKQFHRDRIARRVSVAGHIRDFSPLESLSAFRRFQSALAERYPYRGSYS